MTKNFCLFMIVGHLILSFVQALPNPDQDSRVQKVYEHLESQQIWIKNGAWTSCGKTLLDVLSHVDQEGLWAEDYSPFVEALQKVDLSSPEEQKKADALLTLATLNYISDMKGERINPHLVDKNIYVKQVEMDETELLKSHLALTNQCDWIHGFGPSTPEYKHLKQLLALYRQKEEQGGWPQLPKGTKLEKGDNGALVETLRAQLMAQDILPSEGQGNDVFDEELEKSLKDYQALHGLEQDGKVGRETLIALNRPIQERIQSIIVNMEKERWLPISLPSRYIRVNIPGFYLKAVNNGSPTFFMPIITGKQYLKTPVFNASMTEIIFNPSWHVPASIAKELLPKIRSNPEAYASKGYHIYDNSEDGRARIIQSPGNANALGKIRFTIESPFAIYLHGTPQQNLFQKANRALSHGCIRVEDPYKLAAFVFDNPQKWALSHIKDEASGTTTRRVKLEQALPVFITYFTVFEGENLKMHFVEDGYGQDKQVWGALKKIRRNIKG